MIYILERENTDATLPEWVIIDTPQEYAHQAFHTPLKHLEHRAI